MSVADRITSRSFVRREAVDEVFGEKGLFVRQLSVEGSRGFRRAASVATGAEDDTEADKFNELFVLSCFHGLVDEVGERVFSTDDHLAWLRTQPAEELAKAAVPFLKLNGMTSDTEDREAGNSSETPSAASSTE